MRWAIGRALSGRSGAKGKIARRHDLNRPERHVVRRAELARGEVVGGSRRMHRCAASDRSRSQSRALDRSYRYEAAPRASTAWAPGSGDR